MGCRSIITLMTDFGTADSYVGAMKGVILGIAPNVRMVDISHQIAPQNVRQAAYVLYTAYRFFPSHAIHLVVVDPGVGSARRPVALRTSAGTFVGPDNGVFSYVMARESVETIVELADRRYRLPQVSRTFHGRDIFAPAAAHLAAGVPIVDLGPPVHDAVTLPFPRLKRTPDAIVGEVLYTDRFGNVVTSIGVLSWDGDMLSLEPILLCPADTESIGQQRFRATEARVLVAGRKLTGICQTYAAAAPGEALALVGSAGHLEIAVREGSGAEDLGLEPGDEVRLCLN